MRVDGDSVAANELNNAIHNGWTEIKTEYYPMLTESYQNAAAEGSELLDEEYRFICALASALRPLKEVVQELPAYVAFLERR